MKPVPLSIRDFALPVPRTGSIEAQSGFGRATQDGIEIHQEVQARRGSEDSGYEAEVKLSREFEREGYLFQIGGRIDGLFRSDPPRIEEIKTTFNLGELVIKLEENLNTHPYCLQLKTYGYFYWLEHGVMPELSFHLVSTRKSETQNLKIKLDIASYEAWLETRLAELVEEAKQAEKRAARRRSVAADFPFPFPKPRRGQKELIATIEEGMSKKERMLIQAPTGLGKTAGVLYPTLRESLSRGQRVVYVTPKNSQHSVAEDAVERFQHTGAKVRSLTITAKSKICFKNEPLCNPNYCEYARDYYGKVHENQLLEKLAAKKSLTSRTFKKMGEEFEVCPFELQLDSAKDADVVVCDYNYVFAPRSALGRTSDAGLGQEGKPNLVIDEAHNLMSRAMDYYSPSISTWVLERLREDCEDLPSRFRKDVDVLIDDCIQTVISCRPDSGEKTKKITPPTRGFLEQDGQLRSFLSRYLESEAEIQPRDPVLRLSFYWSEFTEALQYVTEPARPEFFTTFQRHATGGIVKITCCDASEMLKSCYDDYDQVVGFSATLRPFDYYAKLSGLDPATIKTAEFASPFESENRKLLIIPQISTKFTDRNRNYPKIADAIARIADIHPGNYFVFFPSFDFLERTIELFVPPDAFEFRRQERDMKAIDIEALMEHLKYGGKPTIVFAVQGGVFSEGVDYPGDMIIGAFIIGPPLPSYDLEREEMRAYYDRQYGRGVGFDYAYTFTAMAKAVQAAGRVIRTETDRGLIVLMDQRFVQPSYSRSMPADWFEKGPQELVSQTILNDVRDFWNGSASSASSSSSPSESS